MEAVISTGYEPGAIGAVVSLHGAYYAQHWGFGLFFEGKVAREISDFLLRYDAVTDRFLMAREGNRVIGSVTLDGADPESPPGFAHLRWFIVAEDAQGRGIGRRLIELAMGFAQDAGFKGVYLWTFRGLNTARRLYLDTGFCLAEEHQGEMWGTPVTEQRYVAQLLPTA
ncbi:MAG: GNAT family N-acetyltransferase [Betaproteobacteria bacterium]|nr:GNAT family N-acetyltransferase [Betaproteobacteria bacterium]